MAGYFIASYDLTDTEMYAKYNPGSMPIIMKTLKKHEGKILTAGGRNFNWIAGKRQVLVVIEFPSVEAAQNWVDDPEYAPAKAIRMGSTTNRIEVVTSQFVLPSR